MTAILADALRQGARTARGLLTPLAGPELALPPTAPSLTQELQARIEAARDETLEYHRTHRPANTARNYAPKQREWKAWCAAQGFPPGGQYLPGDWVNEGKLLLFIKEEVAARAPRARRGKARDLSTSESVKQQLKASLSSLRSARRELAELPRTTLVVT
jgi:hypothetical protein